MGVFIAENHCMFCPKSEILVGSFYPLQQKRIRYVVNAWINDEAASYSWNVLTQLHPGTFPSSWRREWQENFSYQVGTEVAKLVNGVWKVYVCTTTHTSNALWDSGQNYDVGNLVAYTVSGNTTLYECLAVHTSSSTNAPPHTSYWSDKSDANLPPNSNYWLFVKDDRIASRSPIIAVRLDSGNWAFAANGALGTQPTEYSYEYAGSDTHGVLPFAGEGDYEFVIEFSADSTTGANGFAKCTVNGTDIGEVIGNPIGVYRVVNSQLVAGKITSGTYVGGLPLVPNPAPTDSNGLPNPPVMVVNSAMLFED